MAKALIPLAQGCEELEAVTIIDLLRRADIKVVTAGLHPGTVKASRGVVLVPDVTLEQVENDFFDLLVLPGGLPGADNLNEDSRIHSLLHRTHANGGLVAAICAAPKVLANSGLLSGKKATSFPGVLKGVQVNGLQLVDESVVVDNRIITSRGPGTAIDFTLTLIELLTDTSTKIKVELELQRI